MYVCFLCCDLIYRRVVQAICMRMIGSIRNDRKNNTVYHTHKLLQCLLLSFARVVCNCCKIIERKKYCVTNAERFTRRWPFCTSMTSSDGGDCFALLSCTWRWMSCTRQDRESASVCIDIVKRSYCLRKDRVSVSVCDNIVRKFYYLQKGGVCVSVCNNLIISSHFL